jgi:branched-chain amino acid transport system substrate-binding protein
MFGVRRSGRLLKRIAMLFGVFGVLFFFILPHAHAKSIKIGIIGAMKEAQGKHHWISASMAAEEINKAGGVKVGKEKYTIELLKVDSNENVNISDAVSAYRRAVGDVDFMVGGFRSEAGLGMMEVMADTKKIYVGAGTGSNAASEKVKQNYDRYKYWFKAGPLAPGPFSKFALAPLKTVIAQIRKELGIQKPKLAILADQAIYSELPVKNILAQADELGIEVVGVWRPSARASSVLSELTAIKNAGAQILYTYCAGPSGLAYSKQWGELKIPAAVVGLNVEAGRLTHWKDTAQMCNYVSTITFYGPVEATPRSLPFYNNFIKRSGGEAPNNAAAAYDAVYMLKEAAERAGTIETEAMVKSLEKTDMQGAFGRIQPYGINEEWPHEVRCEAGFVTTYVSQWQDGELKVIWPDGGSDVKGIRYKGTVDYKLPPWMVEYWKNKK